MLYNIKNNNCFTHSKHILYKLQHECNGLPLFWHNAFFDINTELTVSGQNATGQNVAMSKTDKMPQCRW